MPGSRVVAVGAAVPAVLSWVAAMAATGLMVAVPVWVAAWLG